MGENEIAIKNLETLKGEDAGKLLAKGIDTIEALATLRPGELTEPCTVLLYILEEKTCKHIL